MEKQEYIEVTPKMLPTQKEMKAIFKKHNLDLSFPKDAPDGSTVTDYTYWYSQCTFKDSDLRRFICIIGANREYKGVYDIRSSISGCSVDIYKIIK